MRMADISEGSQIGPFTILRALPVGRGGMARVYMARLDARANGDSQAIALKIAHTESEAHTVRHAETFFEALNNEVELLKRLKHPNIVKLYPIPGVANKDPYMARAPGIYGQPWYCVMEYLAGGSLHHFLQANGKLSVKDAVEIAYQVGLALDFVHSKGIAHLDVKPDNVLFRTGLGDEHRIEAVLIDFGIATRGSRQALDAGAMSYLAPERLRVVRREIPPEAIGEQYPVDVYSLGILLYRMLTATLPFRGESRDHLTSAILYSAPTRPSQFNRDIPLTIEELILSALEKDPRARPTASEFTERLDEAVPPPRVRLRTAPSNVLPPPRRSSPWLNVLGAIVLTGAGLAAGYLAGTTLKTPSPSVTNVPTIATEIPAVATALPTKSLAPNTLEPTLAPTSERTVLPPTSTLVPTRVPTATFTPTRVLTRTSTWTPTSGGENTNTPLP